MSQRRAASPSNTNGVIIERGSSQGYAPCPAECYRIAKILTNVIEARANIIGSLTFASWLPRRLIRASGQRSTTLVLSEDLAIDGMSSNVSESASGNMVRCVRRRRLRGRSE